MSHDPISDEGRAAMCEGKPGFDSAKVAHEVAKRSRFPLEAYRCLCCGKFHVGNPPKRKRRRPSEPPKARKIRNRNGVRNARA